MTLPVWLGRAVYWIAWPGLYLYLRWSTRTRVLVLQDERILLVQSWLGDGTWGLPGGGLHRNEDPALGAARETAEETGVVIPAGQLTVLTSETLRSHALQSFCHFFVATLEQKQALTPQPYEIVDARWFTTRELTTIPCKSEVQRALSLLANR